MAQFRIRDGKFVINNGKAQRAAGSAANCVCCPKCGIVYPNLYQISITDVVDCYPTPPEYEFYLNHFNRVDIRAISPEVLAATIYATIADNVSVIVSKKQLKAGFDPFNPNANPAFPLLHSGESYTSYLYNWFGPHYTERVAYGNAYGNPVVWRNIRAVIGFGFTCLDINSASNPWRYEAPAYAPGFIFGIKGSEDGDHNIEYPYLYDYTYKKAVPYGNLWTVGESEWIADLTTFSGCNDEYEPSTAPASATMTVQVYTP